jgi:3-hydroxyacyl-[acyl-carrier-protein] dehydratase
MNSMDIRQILEHLPHRYPLLLVDRVITCEPNKNIVAIKNVTINEQFFCGHFPRHPVMPGVLIIEAIAQAAAILTFLSHNAKPNDESIYYFAGIDKARFKRPVTPGDTLELHADITRYSRGVWWYKGEARVDGQVVTEANMMCALRSAEHARAKIDPDQTAQQ